MNIVLHEPEIPENTGNIGRTCVATDSVLHLIKPLGFVIDDKHLKRAGLDYWHLVHISYHDSFSEIISANPNATFYFFSTKAQRKYTEAVFTENDFLVFGKETAGLPESLLKEHWDTAVRIPMREDARSLNLSNAVAIASYEALRQLSFLSL